MDRGVTNVGEGGDQVKLTLFGLGDFLSVHTDSKGHRKEKQGKCTYDIWQPICSSKTPSGIQAVLV